MKGKATFETALVSEHLVGPWHRLVRPLVYRSEILDRKIIVPTGVVTDFASVPRWPIVYWIAGNRTDEAAALHDYLYRTGPGQEEPFNLDVDRPTCDRVYYEAMIATKYSRIYASNNYYWVRMAGGGSFRKHPGEWDPRT